MGRYVTHLICAVSITVSIWFVSFYSSQYYIEQAKQDGIIAKSCVENGGQWVKNFGPSWNCEK